LYEELTQWTCPQVVWKPKSCPKGCNCGKHHYGHQTPWSSWSEPLQTLDQCRDPKKTHGQPWLHLQDVMNEAKHILPARNHGTNVHTLDKFNGPWTINSLWGAKFFVVIVFKLYECPIHHSHCANYTIVQSH